MRVIALHGFQGVGKDTVGAYIADKYGYTSMSFAAKLKTFLEQMNPLINDPNMGLCELNFLIHPSYGGWDEGKRKYAGVRNLLISAGEGLKAALGPQVWANALLDTVEHMDAIDDLFLVITDLRFYAELEVLIEAFEDDLLTVKITRDGPAPDEQTTDAGLDQWEFDYTLTNNGTIQELYARVGDMMEDTR